LCSWSLLVPPIVATPSASSVSFASAERVRVRGARFDSHGELSVRCDPGWTEAKLQRILDRAGIEGSLIWELRDGDVLSGELQPCCLVAPEERIERVSCTFARRRADCSRVKRSSSHGPPTAEPSDVSK
jgi:hypothetical protein